MINLSEEIQRILTVLEDARDEKDWEMVNDTIADLEKVYEELDRQENGFTYEYEFIFISKSIFLSIKFFVDLF